MTKEQLEYLYSTYMWECRKLHEEDYFMGDSEISIAVDIINWDAEKHHNITIDLLTVADALAIGFQMGRQYEAKEQGDKWEEAANEKEETENESYH